MSRHDRFPPRVIRRITLVRSFWVWIASTLCVALVASFADRGRGVSAWRSDWTAIFDTTGNCSYSVPPRWKFEDRTNANTIAMAPDGRAIEEQDWISVPNWSMYTSRLRLALKPTVVHEDSTSRFWIEFSGGWSGVHHFIAIPAAGGACTTHLDVSDRADPELHATVAAIILTVTALR